MDFNDTQKRLIANLFVDKCLANRTLAARLGISYPGITLTADPLVKNGILIKGKESPTGKVGRTEENLSLNPDAFYMLGIDIRWHSYFVSVTNFVGEIIENKRILALTELAAYLNDLKARFKPILGIGITIRGYVNFGRFLEENIEFISVLDESHLPYHCLSYMESLAAIYRLYHPADSNFLLLKYGPYVDSAIFVNGKCVKDRNGVAADVARTYIGGESLGEGYWFRALLNGEKPEPEEGVKMLKDSPQQYLRFIEAMAQTIVNCDAMCSLDRVILCGYVLQDQQINDDLEDAILSLNPDYDVAKNIHYDHYGQLTNKKGSLQVFIDNFLD